MRTMVEMNNRRREMWKASRWQHYNDFRVFIMGVKGNEELFGDGVTYTGVWDEPKQFRGQTGAQDDIIPMEDIFSGVINYYPKNELTKYLLDLRTYRPKCIQQFFIDLEKEVEGIHSLRVNPCSSMDLFSRNSLGLALEGSEGSPSRNKLISYPFQLRPGTRIRYSTALE